MSINKHLSDRPSPAWFSRREMADLFDVDEGTFDRSYRRFVDSNAIKRVGKKLYFHARSTLDSWAAQRSAPNPDDAMLRGSDSPSLERYRQARADIAEIERDRQRENNVPRRQMVDVLSGLSPRLRRAAAKLERMYGADAGRLLDEAVDEWERGVNHLLGGAE